MDDKKQDFKQNLKSYVSDEEIVQPDDYFEEKPVDVGVNDDVNDDVNGVSDVTQSQESTKSNDDYFAEINQKYTNKQRKSTTTNNKTPKRLPKSGSESEIMTLAMSGLLTAAGFVGLKKKRKDR